MIKISKFLLIGLIVVSCNSKENKNNKVDYPEKTSLSQTNPELTSSMERGKIVYNDLCITCHLADGKGVSKVFPPLANSDFLKKNQTESILGVKNGMSGKIIVNGLIYDSVMAPLGLTDDEIADVVNYINNSWGNKIDNFVTPEKVSEL